MTPQPSTSRSSFAGGAVLRAPVPSATNAATWPEQWSSFLAGVLPAGPWYERSGGRVAVDGAGYERTKRLIDLTISLALLPFVLVVLALCALAIRINSSGPVIFHQLRTGKGGRRFKMYKLRTMVRNAEELKAQMMHLNELTYPDFKITNDPRVTRVGWFLRKTSLDELPQLFNVIRGEMSLVGPRPTSFSAGTYSLWHTARLEVKPGLTGLWQISGRSSLDFDDRLRLDIAYVRNRSVWLDLKIMFRTVHAVLDGRGAS